MTWDFSPKPCAKIQQNLKIQYILDVFSTKKIKNPFSLTLIHHTSRSKEGTNIGTIRKVRHMCIYARNAYLFVLYSGVFVSNLSQVRV